uniref:Berberine/berberine-like domain-containing protein n=1 Tax=Kalanchoe fedtschenkoi TaxID=63787 RepID=A0A7N0RFE0_KALFE
MKLSSAALSSLSLLVVSALSQSSKFPLLGGFDEGGRRVETSWVKSTKFWYNVPLSTSADFLLRRAPSGSSHLKRKSDYGQSPIPRLGLEAVWKKMIQLGGNVSMQSNPYGGRMAEISPSETPFPHRAGNLWLIQYSSNWKDAADGETRLDAINQLYDLMTTYVSKSPREALLNYRDVDLGTTAHGQADSGYSYFKANFHRLIRVKAAVDPGNFFHYEQSIPTKSVV